MHTCAVCCAMEPSPAAGAAGMSQMYLAEQPVGAMGIMPLLAFTFSSISSSLLESNLPGQNIPLLS